LDEIEHSPTRANLQDQTGRPPTVRLRAGWKNFRNAILLSKYQPTSRQGCEFVNIRPAALALPAPPGNFVTFPSAGFPKCKSPSPGGHFCESR